MLSATARRFAEENITLARQIGWAMYEKNKWLIDNSPAYDYEDVMEEAMLSLSYAASKFDDARGIPFSAFARKVISNHMIDFFRSGYKHRISTCHFWDDDTDGDRVLVVEDDLDFPEWGFKDFMDTLTKEEQFILKQILAEKSQGEIAAACRARFGGLWTQAKNITFSQAHEEKVQGVFKLAGVKEPTMKSHTFSFKAFLLKNIDCVGLVGRYARIFGARRGFPLWDNFLDTFLDYTLDLAEALHLDGEECEELCINAWHAYEVYHFFIQCRSLLADALEAGCLIKVKEFHHEY